MNLPLEYIYIEEKTPEGVIRTPAIVAKGPEGLTGVLEMLLDHSKKDAQFAAAEHYILYQLNQQNSLIKVDTHQQPFHFWYYDLRGRPATNIVKETIARFLWEKCGCREQYSKEVEEE